MTRYQDRRLRITSLGATSICGGALREGYGVAAADVISMFSNRVMGIGRLDMGGIGRRLAIVHWPTTFTSGHAFGGVSA